MTSSGSSELDRVRLLARILGTKNSRPEVSVGIGDDAAAFTVGDASLVWTVDAQVEGTHFRSSWLSWQDVGFRSFMAAASDLAAMGAEPLFGLSSLVLAPAFDDTALEALAEGQAEAARVVGAPIVGGNLARGGETSITTTFLGRTSTPVLRSGARVGDRLYVAGSPGRAAAGLDALMVGDPLAEPSVAACVQTWRRPRARIEEGQRLREASTRATVGAAIDVSDGLARDASHIAAASGVRLVFDEGKLLATADDDLKGAAALLSRSLLDWILFGGEDYALLTTSAEPIDGFVEVGLVTSRAHEEGLVALQTASGVRALPLSGFDHFG